MRFRIIGTHLDETDEEAPTKIENLVTEDDFESEEAALAICEQLAKDCFERFEKLQDMEFENEFKPDPPSIEKIENGWKSTYIWEEFQYVATQVK